MIKDAAIENWIGQPAVNKWHLWAAAAGAVLVVAIGYAIRRAHHKRALEHPLIIDPPGPEEFPQKTS
jgi:hypothetical protein